MGRTATKTRGTHTATYAYHYGDKLVSVDSDFIDEDDVTYEYGGNGLRRERTTGGVSTTYNWDGYAVVSEENSSGDLTRTYVGGAHIDGTNPSTGTYSYYAVDHLGSTRAVYDQSKNEIGAFEYSPYGNPLLATNTGLTTHLFTGHDLDAQTGLYFAPFRNYNPNAARWTTRDPLGMINGPNVYGYVGGNPILLADPLGLYCWSDVAVPSLITAGAVAGTLAGYAFKAAAGVALGVTPVGWLIIGAALVTAAALIVAYKLNKKRLEHEADDVDSNSIFKGGRDQLEDVLDGGGWAPSRIRNTPPGNLSPDPNPSKWPKLC